MPEPRQGETQKEFLQRCMGDSESIDTFPDHEQRAAFCFSQWREAQDNMEANDLNTNRGCCKNTPIMANAEVTGKTKVFTHEGKQVMSIPVVAIVEGVLNDFLVPSDEFGKFVNSWEGIPIPVDHPQVNGMHVSANLPDILSSRNIGRFHNVKVDGNKLKGEMWVFVDDAKSKGFDEVVNRLEKGEKIEVSTAYFADTENTRGKFNGTDYSGIHRNLRPDHLAILPEDIGACSIEQGCGTFQNNLKGAIMSKFDKMLEVLGLKANEFKDKEQEIMSLISNVDGEEEKPEEMQEEEDMKEEEAKTNSDKKSKIGGGTSNIDKDSLIAVNWAKEKYAKEKSKLVDKLTANERCAFSKEELQGMTVNVLEKLNDSFSADYSGRGFPVTHKAEEETVLEMKPVVMAKEAK